jgi:hypothetical protein
MEEISDPIAELKRLLDEEGLEDRFERLLGARPSKAGWGCRKSVLGMGGKFSRSGYL